MTHEPRVYGSDSETDTGPEPGHDYRELVGGPLDGQLLDATDRTEGTGGTVRLSGGVVSPRVPASARHWHSFR